MKKYVLIICIFFSWFYGNNLWAKGAPEAARNLTATNAVLNGGKYWVGPVNYNQITFRWDPPIEDADHNPANQYYCFFQETGTMYIAAYGWPFTTITDTTKTVTFDKNDLIEHDYVFRLVTQYASFLNTQTGGSAYVTPIRYDSGTPYLFANFPQYAWETANQLIYHTVTSGNNFRNIFIHGAVTFSANVRDSASGINNSDCILSSSFMKNYKSLLSYTNSDILSSNTAIGGNSFFIDTVSQYGSNDGLKGFVITFSDRVGNSLTNQAPLVIDNSPPEPAETISVYFTTVPNTPPGEPDKPESVLSGATVAWDVSPGDRPLVFGEYTGQAASYYCSFTEMDPRGNFSFYRQYNTNTNIQCEVTFERGRPYKCAVITKDQLGNEQDWPADTTYDPKRGAMYPNPIYIPQSPAYIDKIYSERIPDSAALSHKVTVVLDKPDDYLYREGDPGKGYAIGGMRLYSSDAGEAVSSTEHLLIDDTAPAIEARIGIGTLDSPGWKILDSREDEPVIYVKNENHEQNYGRLAYTFVTTNNPHGRPRFKVETVHLDEFSGTTGMPVVEYENLSYYFMEQKTYQDENGIVQEQRLPNYRSVFDIKVEELDEWGNALSEQYIDPFSADPADNPVVLITSDDFRVSVVNIENEYEEDEVVFKALEIDPANVETRPFTQTLAVRNLDIIQYLEQDENGHYALSLQYIEKYTGVDENGDPVTRDGLLNDGIENPVRIAFDYRGNFTNAPGIDTISSPGYITSRNTINNVSVILTNQAYSIAECRLVVLPLSSVPGGVQTVEEISTQTGFSFVQIYVYSVNNLRNITLSVPYEFTEGTQYTIAAQVRGWNGLWSNTAFSAPLSPDFSRPEITADGSDIIINDYTEAGNGTGILTLPITIPFSVDDDRESIGVEFYLLSTDESVQLFRSPEQLLIESTMYNQEQYYDIPRGTLLCYGFNRLYVCMTETEENGNTIQTDVFIRNIIINRPPEVILGYSAVNPGEEIDFMDYLSIFDEDFTYTPDMKGSPVQYEFGYEWDFNDDGVIDAVSSDSAQRTFTDLNYNGIRITVWITDPRGKRSEGSSALVFVMPTKSGYLQGDEIWGMYTINGVSGDRYAITGDVYTLGYSLTITGGVTVIVLKSDIGIYVQSGGELIINNGSTLRYRQDIGNGSTLYWEGITAFDGARITLENAAITNSVRALTLQEIPGGLATEAWITNSAFLNNLTGIHLLGMDLTITGCTFSYNRYYALKEDSNANFQAVSCIFTANGLNEYPDNSGDYYDYYDYQTRSMKKSSELFE